MKYSFGPDSLLSRVEVVRTETGAKRAYLEAAADADKAKLASVREALAKHGYITVPVEVGGKPLLEVRKFTDADSLLKQLTDAGAIKGIPSQSTAVSDRIGVWQWVKNNTFKMCLAFYCVGDLGYYFYGSSKEKFGGLKGNLENRIRTHQGRDIIAPPRDNPFDKYAGIFYNTGTAISVPSTIMRGDQSDEEVQAVSEKMREKFQEEGATTTSTTYKAIEDEKSAGLLQRIKTAFIKHPSEMFNTCYAFAGFFMIRAARRHLGESKIKIAELNTSISNAERTGNTAIIEGLKEDAISANKSRKIAMQDIGLGSITMASGAISTLVKERPKNPDEPEPTNPISKAWRWLQEKPLRIAGGGYLLSTLIHGSSTMQDYVRINKDKSLANSMMSSSNKVFSALGKEKLALAVREQKITHGRLLFCINNGIGEIFMMLSSKGHGDGVKSDATVEPSATAIAAETIALQAPEKREELIQKMATHLASPKVMGGSSAVIMGNIRENLKNLAHNPWADASNDAHYAQPHQASR